MSQGDADAPAVGDGVGGSGCDPLPDPETTAPVGRNWVPQVQSQGGRGTAGSGPELEIPGPTVPIVGSPEGSAVGTGDPMAVGVGGLICVGGSAPDGAGLAEGSAPPEPATPWRRTVDSSQPSIGSPQRGGM